jgi:hypothetical protein
MGSIDRHECQHLAIFFRKVFNTQCVRAGP